MWKKRTVSAEQTPRITTVAASFLSKAVGQSGVTNDEEDHGGEAKSVITYRMGKSALRIHCW